MNRGLLTAFFTLIAFGSPCQSFDLLSRDNLHKGFVGDIVKAPLVIKNLSEKSVTLIIRKVSSEIGGTQKSYFCIDQHCLDQKVEEYTLKLEPQQTHSNVQVALDAGLAHGISSLKYLIFNKYNPLETTELELNFAIDEKLEKQSIYASAAITLRDVYPIPVIDYAVVDYAILDDRVKSSIIIHDLLGNPIEELTLSPAENKVKIRTEALTSGIYFYTLYVDNEGVVTRKFIVKK